MLGGTLYPISTDFRVGIAYCNMLLSGAVLYEAQILALWFPQSQPPDFSAAREAVDEFYRCGKSKTKATGGAVPYSFMTDSAALVAAFQKEYGIDLTTVKMHWWRFQALLQGLTGHSFTERVQYRMCDLSEIKSKDMRARYSKMQHAYALDEHGNQAVEPTTLEEYEAQLLLRATGR